MTQSKNDLGLVSDLLLARILMTRLWHIYDLGGISLRRSLRASLLELAMDLIDIESRMWDVDLDLLINEAKSRIITEKVQFQSELVVGLPVLSAEQLICLILGELGKWYSQDPTILINSDTYVSIEERKIYNAFAYLLQVEKGISEFHSLGFVCTTSQLLFEGEQRRRMKYEIEVEPLDTSF